MVAGLSTGSIIAMAMDFSMWPRVYDVMKVQPKEEDSSEKVVETNEDNENLTTALVHKSSEEEEATPEMNQQHGVENDEEVDQVKTDEEHPLPTEVDTADETPVTKLTQPVPDEEDEGGIPDEEDKTSKQQTTSIVSPVPDNDTPPKTLLEKAQEVDSTKEGE